MSCKVESVTAENKGSIKHKLKLTRPPHFSSKSWILIVFKVKIKAFTVVVIEYFPLSFPHFPPKSVKISPLMHVYTHIVVNFTLAYLLAPLMF